MGQLNKRNVDLFMDSSNFKEFKKQRNLKYEIFASDLFINMSDGKKEVITIQRVSIPKDVFGRPYFGRELSYCTRKWLQFED